MFTETLIFTQQFVDQVNTQYGSKTKNTFVTGDGRRFETWKPDVAATVAAYMNQPAVVVYEQKVSGQYTNLVIQSIAPAGGAGPAPVAAPAPAPQPGPAPVAAAAPAPQGGVTQQAKELSIQRQSALKAAIQAFEAAGIDPVTESQALVEWADQVAFTYFTQGLLEPEEVVEA